MTSQEADRREIERLHDLYLNDVNSHLDTEGLRSIWSANPRNWYFNGLGTNYKGREHWIELWKYLRQRMVLAEWRDHDRDVRVHGDVGWVTCWRESEIDWTGSDDNLVQATQGGFKRSRSTEIFLREPEGWRVVHAHFSPMSDDRPGGI